MGLYMGGLKEKIRLEVQSLDPSTRYKAISIAQNMERKLIKARVLKVTKGGRK